MPEEMRLLGEFLATEGFTVMGLRLAGHATQPDDLKRTRWTDWLLNVEDGLALLSNTCKRFVLIGQSMGGMIVLTAVARCDVQGVVAMSTPFVIPVGNPPTPWQQKLVRHTIIKQVERFPHEHPLFHRRELGYPAYPEFPSRILVELSQLGAAMTRSLPEVHVLVLLIHSKDDQSVPFSCMHNIYDRLGSVQKEMLALEGMDHSLMRDPQRQVVFEAVEKFLRMVEELKRKTEQAVPTRL